MPDTTRRRRPRSGNPLTEEERAEGRATRERALEVERDIRARAGLSDLRLKPGETVAAFERAFADYVGARYGVACCNGTATLHVALLAAGVTPGQDVYVPALTMASTSIAVLLAGANPAFRDVHADTWLMEGTRDRLAIPVSLYGSHYDHANIEGPRIDDAAQTLRPHDPRALFTSYSFQGSKILATGEGGMLVTDREDLAQAAREYASLGYRMTPDSSRIDKAALKAREYVRHYRIAPNYRMAESVAALGLAQLEQADALLAARRAAADLYREAHDGCDWLTPQLATGPHDYWAYPLAITNPSRWDEFANAIVRHGGECPYPAWRVTYTEPAFAHLARVPCLNAERLQSRILAFQTNDVASAEKNAKALRKAIREVGG